LSVVVRAVKEAEGSGAESIVEQVCGAAVALLSLSGAGLALLVDAVPMRVRGETVGALNLFRSVAGRLADRDMPLGQGMADIAAIALLQERADRRPAGRDNPREHGAWRFVFGLITIALWRNGPARSKVAIGSV
jgi:hypothetical protein